MSTSSKTSDTGPLVAEPASYFDESSPEPDKHYFTTTCNPPLLFSPPLLSPRSNNLSPSSPPSPHERPCRSRRGAGHAPYKQLDARPRRAPPELQQGRLQARHADGEPWVERRRAWRVFGEMKMVTMGHVYYIDQLLFDAILIQREKKGSNCITVASGHGMGWDGRAARSTSWRG